MPTTSPSIYMALPNPVPSTTPGPEWAEDIFNCLVLLDAHSHVPGSGVQITPAAIDINDNLTFNDYAITDAAYLNMTAQLSDPSPNFTVYAKGADLYYTDGNGNHIRLTISGGPNAGTGNISNLPSTPSGLAGITWSNAQSTFQLIADNGSSAASLDAATVILRYVGGYPTPSGNYIALQAPASLSAPLAFTLPATVPSLANGFFVSSTSGIWSYVNTDNSTVEVSGSTLRVKASGITSNELATDSVITAKILNSAVTTAKIADGNVTSAKIETSILLPGVPTSGGRAIVSNYGTAPLALGVIQGVIQTTGAIISGQGFSCVRNSTGTYTLTWNVAFANEPSVIVTVANDPAVGTSVTATTSTTSSKVDTYNSGNSHQDYSFSFIAIGTRAS